jgi:excisionase family DNA binding protein
MMMTPADELLTTAEVAAWLRIDLRTVYRLKAQGMPCYQKGHILRFKRGDIESWMQQPPVVIPVTSPRAVPAHFRPRQSVPSVAEVHAQLNEVIR